MFNSISSMLYIDPAATSVLLSSITAICVAVGATFIVIWRKLKNKINKTLHIDQNANKEVEEDLVIKDENEETEAKSLEDEKKNDSLASTISDEKEENKDTNEKEDK